MSFSSKMTGISFWQCFHSSEQLDRILLFPTLNLFASYLLLLCADWGPVSYVITYHI